MLERVLRRQKGGARYSTKLSITGATRRGLFAFLSVDIAQLKSTSVVTRGHNRLRRKGLDPTKVNREGFGRARNLPADFVHPPTMRTSTPLWTLRINHVASLLLLQIQSYVPLLTVRRLIELTRNLVFVFKLCHAILITIKTRETIWRTDTWFYLYRDFARDLLTSKIGAKIKKLQQVIFRNITLTKSILNIVIRLLTVRIFSLC